jgi:tripeptidyl-peptidase-2
LPVLGEAAAAHNMQQHQEFPAPHLLPKSITQAAAFLQSYPKDDGSGVVVAILDTGVDPGANGLQTCPDGRPKILDLVDCSGSGDVDMTARRTAQDADPSLAASAGSASKVEEDDGAYAPANRKLTLLSNRVVTLGAGKRCWSCPANEFRVGKKAVFDMFPKPLVARLKQERKESWSRQHAVAEAEAARALSAHPLPAQANKEDVKRRKDLEDRAELLKQARDAYVDDGPTVDVIAFQDAERMWRVVVSAADDGEDLSAVEPLAPFRAERKYARFGWGSQLNYAVNVHSEGDVVSLVVDSGAHGTHVAGIVAVG